MGSWPLAYMEQALEQAGIKTGLLKRGAFGQEADRVMAVQAFLVACQNTEIAHAWISLQLAREKAGRIFHKDRVCGV